MTRNDAFRIWDAKVKHYNAGTLVPTNNGRGRLPQEVQDRIAKNFEDGDHTAYFTLAQDYAPRKRERVGGCIAKYRTYTATVAPEDQALEVIKSALKAGTMTPEQAQPYLAKIESRLKDAEDAKVEQARTATLSRLDSLLA